MDFKFSDEQNMLRDTVRSFITDKAPPARVREWMETDSGFEPSLWREMADLGLTAMHIPEEYGGAGFSYRELGIVLEELGRELTPSPMLSTVVFGANLVLLAGSEEQKRTVLPHVAAGETTLALAVMDEHGTWDPGSIATTIVDDGDELVITGTKSYVVDGHTADSLIVVGRGESGAIRHAMVAGDAAGVTTTRLVTMDMTRPQARVELDAVRVPASAELAAATGSTLERLADLAAVALAYEQVGGSQRVMEMAVEYAKVRYQFGRAIGSFQAIKHACADMLVSVESARSAAYAAGWAVDNDPADLVLLAPLARSVCSEAYFEIAAANIQVHGGIGFTWEHDAHLFFKRAKTSQLMIGSPAQWRARLADRMGV